MGAAPLTATRSPLYGSPKYTPWESSCPPGSVLRGIDYRSGNILDDVTNMHCAPISDPNSASDSTVAVFAADEKGGTPGTYRCPDGQAVSGISGQLDGKKPYSYPVAQLSLNCRDVKAPPGPAGKFNAGPVIGKNKGHNYAFISTYPWFATGMAGTGGGNVDAIQLIGRDFTPDISGGNKTIDPPPSINQPAISQPAISQPSDSQSSANSQLASNGQSSANSQLASNGQSSADSQLASNGQSSADSQPKLTEPQQSVSGDNSWLWIILILVFVILAMLAGGVALFMNRSSKVGKYEPSGSVSSMEL